MSEIVYRGIVRFSNGSKSQFDIRNVDHYETARSSLLDLPNAKCAMILIPCIKSQTRLEPVEAA